MSHPHIDHVRAHFERVRHGHLVDPSPETLYLGAEEDEYFWELIGVRITGCPVVVLALLRFQRLDLPTTTYARESLATYLSMLPTPREMDEAGVLTAILPPHDQNIPFFLKRLRAGLRPRPVSLDPARVEVAFDFRLQNPTLIPEFRDEAPPLIDHYYRTVDGHLLRGRSHEIPASEPEEHGCFVAVSTPEQITPTGTYPFPTLVLNRRYMALRARAATHDEAAAVRNWVPFMPASAAGGSILPLPDVHVGQRPAVGPTAMSPPPGTAAYPTNARTAK